MTRVRFRRSIRLPGDVGFTPACTPGAVVPTVTAARAVPGQILIDTRTPGTSTLLVRISTGLRRTIDGAPEAERTGWGGPGLSRTRSS